MKISAITPKPRLFEDMIREDTTYKAFNRAGRMLIERNMSEEEILKLFANIEKGVTAAGNAPGGASNRTLLGKGKDAATDAATAISNAFSTVDKKIGISSGIKSFDASYDILARKLGDKVGQDGKIMTAIKKYREFAKAHPIMQGAIYAGLIALTGLSGAGLGGAVILGGIKLFDKLLLDNKASSSLWSGFLTGATAWGIGQAQQAYAAHNAAGVTPQSQMNADDIANGSGGASSGPDPLAPGTPVTPQSQMDADDIANGSGGPDAPALDAETMANNAANAKAYGIDGADTTADMNKAIMQTAEPGTTPADYSQIGAAGNGTEYTVVTGDTLSQIAEKNNVSVDDMMKANPDITNPDVLKAGQEIKIPSATSNAVYDQGVGTASDTAAKVASGQYAPNPASAAPVPTPIPTPTLKPGPGQQYAESRRNMNNMLMEAIVATTNSIKPFKAKTINLSAMIDRQATAHVWMLGESLGRNYKHRYHITEAGIDNIFKNVERYQRHIQIVVTESLLNELEDAPGSKPAPADTPKDVGALLRGKPAGATATPTTPAGATATPTTPAGATATPTTPAGATATPTTPAGATAPKKPGLLSRMWAGAKQIGHQFTTKITAEKLRMDWGKNKPTESDDIAMFLQGQGVPAKVISDVFTQSDLPVPQAITAAAAVVPATPDTAATPAGPGNTDTSAVTKAKSTLGIKPDVPAGAGGTATDAAAGGTATDAAAGGTATDAAATTIPAGEKATTTTQVAEVKKEIDQDIDDLLRSLLKLDNRAQPGFVQYIRDRLDQHFGKPKVASKKRTSDKAKSRTPPPTSPPVTESAPIYTATSKRIPQAESRLTKRAKNAFNMFENFVEKTKVETKLLTESNTRPLIKRVLTEQKAKQSIKITKKAVVPRNEVIDLWKKMPG